MFTKHSKNLEKCQWSLLPGQSKWSRKLPAKTGTTDLGSSSAAGSGHGSGCNVSMVVACFCHVKLRTAVYVLLGLLIGFSFSMCFHSIRMEERLRHRFDKNCDDSNSAKVARKVTVGREIPTRQPLLTNSKPSDKNSHDNSLPDVLNSYDGIPHSSLKTSSGLVFVGVMTAEKYLMTRTVAINQTWASSIHGRLNFFVGGDIALEKYAHLNLPLVLLPHVSDSIYPPQKKSFSMLRRMWNIATDSGTKPSSFEWFMRVDDDAYVQGDKLELLLRSLNSSNSIYMGQTGLGNKEEYGHLSLGDRDNYCMGGTGMIFSKELVRKLNPHLKNCLRTLYTTHEDVELGRCVRRATGVSCTWAYEMQKIFYNTPQLSMPLHPPAADAGQGAKTGSLTAPSSSFANTVTVHAVKDPVKTRQLHLHFRRLKHTDLRYKEIELQREIDTTRIILDRLNGVDVVRATYTTKQASLTKYRPAALEHVPRWSFLTASLEYCTDRVHCPRHNIPSYTRRAIAGVVEEVLGSINKFARQRGRILEFQEILYGYSRTISAHGADYILDLLLMYKKFKGKRMNVPVRRHAYVHQNFGGLRAHVQGTDESRFGRLPGGADAEATLNGQAGKNAEDSKNPVSAPLTSPNEMIYIILPLKGRLDALRRFLENYEERILHSDLNTQLRIVTFAGSEEFLSDLTILLDGVRDRNPHAQILVIPQPSHVPFSRGYAMVRGMQDLGMDSLLFLTDVDVLFTQDFLRRLRLNVGIERQIFFPVVFSEYRPPSVKVRETSKNFEKDSFPAAEDEWPSHFASFYPEYQGYFRHFGYGIVALFKEDLVKIGSYDLSIKGWGYEDVDLFDRCLKKTNLTIFRAPDPDLVHVYHEVVCNAHEMPPAQYKMCLGSMAATKASQKQLAKTVLTDPRFSQFFPPPASQSDDKQRP